jgi:outer membrane receptor protein involved in Fe transport
MELRRICILFVILAIILPLNLNPQDNDTEKIKRYFKMDIHQLLSLVITTAGKKKEKISDIPASVVIVTREEIENYGYQSLIEILENIPGLYLTDDYVNIYTGIRGFWSITPNRNVIILVNGIPYKDELVSSYYLEDIPIPVEAIDRIEVVRGPMSVIYGNGAFFGVINIITNQFDENENPSQVSASVGSEKTRKFFIRMAGKQEDFKYVLNGSYFDTYGIDVPLNKMIIDPSILPNFGLPENHSTGGQLENSVKYFNFSGTFKDFYFDASYAENRKEMMWLYPSISDGTLVVYNDMRIRLGYKRKVSNNFSLETKLSYFLNQLSVDFDMLIDEFYGTQDNRSSGFKAELYLFITPSPRLNITVGIDYLQVLDGHSYITVPTFGANLIQDRLPEGESMVTRSIFSQIAYKLSDRLKIVAGVMLEQTPKYAIERRIGDYSMGNASSTRTTYSHTQVEFIPRLALIYSPNDRNIFKLLYGKAINRPSFFHNLDLLTFPIDPLKPETIHTLEFNYIAQLSSKLTVNLSIFRNVLDKLIYRSIFPVGSSIFLYYSNVGEMTTNGAEMSILFSPTRRFYFELSGTYQDTTDRRPGFENIEVGYSPKFLGYLKASYFINKDISLAVTGNYVDKMESYFDDTLIPPGRLGDRVGGYFLLGANLRVRNFLTTGMFLNLKVSNLLDEEIRYPATASNNLYATKGTIGRGRSFLLTLGWKF